MRQISGKSRKRNLRKSSARAVKRGKTTTTANTAGSSPTREELITTLLKKHGVSWAMKRCDTIYSRFIRNRDPICLFQYAPNVDPTARACSNPSSQNSHFWGRGNKGTRYDDENCDGICGHCHMEHEGSKQGLYSEIKRWQLGDERYDALERRARSSTPLYDVLLAFMLRMW